MSGGIFIRARALSYHLYHHHDFSDPHKAKAETAKRYAAVEHIARKHDDPQVNLIHFWWAHFWPNPFFPDESILRSLVEFDHLYRTISAKKWRAYRSVLDYSRPRMPDEPTSSAHSKEQRKDSECASILIAQGKTHELKGDLARAGRCYDGAISIYASVGDEEKLATSYSSKGFVMQLLHDFDAAIDLHTKSLHINEKIEQKKGCALDLGNLGIVHFLRGDFTTAERFYEGSKDIYHEIGDFAGVANQYNSLANLRKSQGRLHEAKDLLERALEIDTEGDRKEASRCITACSLRCSSCSVIQHRRSHTARPRSQPTNLWQIQKGRLMPTAASPRSTSSAAIFRRLNRMYSRSIELFEHMGMSANLADRHLLLENCTRKQNHLIKQKIPCATVCA